MYQMFHDIARFSRVTDLFLFKYVFNVIQDWETDALQFYFLSDPVVEGDESSQLRMAN